MTDYWDFLKTYFSIIWIFIFIKKLLSLSVDRSKGNSGNDIKHLWKHPSKLKAVMFSIPPKQMEYYYFSWLDLLKYWCLLLSFLSNLYNHTVYGDLPCFQFLRILLSKVKEIVLKIIKEKLYMRSNLKNAFNFVFFKS